MRTRLHLRSLVPVMNDFLWLWWPMISGDGWSLSFPDICLTVEEKFRKKLQLGKLTRPGIEPGRARWEATMLPLDHSAAEDLLILVALCGDFTVSLILFAARFSDICSDTCAMWISYCSESADTRDRTFLLFIFVATFLRQLPRSSDHRGGWGRCTSYIFW